ncbi:MAG: CDP-alcohol phosphatidyltransferase family protein [Chloroflexota bacterium]
MTQSLVSPGLRERVRGLAVPVALAFGRLGLTPNALTVIGFIGTAAAAYAAASQAWLAAGILVIVFGIFDLFDGALARATGKASKFGAFLDSTLDRTGESLVLAGVAVGCAVAGFTPGVLLAGLAATFASGVTYSRAKAESLGLQGEIGIAPRPERLAILAVGLALAGLLGGVTPVTPFTECGPNGCETGVTVLGGGATVLGLALGLIAMLSAITILQRIIHVRRQLDSQQQENQ